MEPKIFLIAQNVNIYSGDGKHQFARTGELGFYHLKKAGATGIILGHSEVGDQPEVVNKKWKSALHDKLFDNVVLVGENWKDLEKGWDRSNEEEIKEMKDKLQSKFLTILEGLNKEAIKKTVFGYEPSWGTRGSGREDIPPPQPAQIKNMSSFMREILEEEYGSGLAKNIRIIYGGSLSPERAEEITPLEDVDGLILGSAGTTTDWVKKIGQSIQEAMKKKKPERKGVLVLNWKAYELKESYLDFLRVLRNFDGDLLEGYLTPVATELKEVKTLL